MGGRGRGRLTCDSVTLMNGGWFDGNVSCFPSSPRDNALSNLSSDRLDEDDIASVFGGDSTSKPEPSPRLPSLVASGRPLNFCLSAEALSNVCDVELFLVSLLVSFRTLVSGSHNPSIHGSTTMSSLVEGERV